MELPPPADSLVDSLSIIYTRNLHDLSKAEWATVNREEYIKIVRERKQCCPAYSEVVICEDEARTRLPNNGVPEHIAACAQEVDGSEKALCDYNGPLPELQTSARTRRPATSRTRHPKVSRATARVSKRTLTHHVAWQRLPSLWTQYTTSSPSK